MELPIDHFRLLGVSPSANAEEVLRAFQLRLDRPPKQGFTYEVLAQRSELLRLSADLLSNPTQRQSYELALLEGSSGLDLSSNREVAGLLLLWESNASLQAFKLAKKALQPPQAPALGSGRESDLTLVAALSCRDASIDEQARRRYASGAELLQEGIQLLQRMGKLVEERKTLESDLENLLPYRILDLLSRDKEDEKSHQEGIRLLEDFVNKRGGLEGKKNSEKIGGLNQNDFELFFLQIRKFLSAKEQSKLYINWYRRGSEDAGFLAAFALIASGFSYRDPELLQEARKYLRNININGFDAMPLIGCLDLLLGDVKQAEARFRSSSDDKLKDWLNNYPGEALGALCDYCRNWLKKDVLVGFRDVETQNVNLDDWFANKEVQEYVEQLETKGALGIAKAGFSFLSSLGPEQQIETNSSNIREAKADLPIPGGSLDEIYKEKSLNARLKSQEAFLKSDLVKMVIKKYYLAFETIQKLDFKSFILKRPIYTSFAAFIGLFVIGTSLGILTQRKPSQNNNLNIISKPEALKSENIKTKVNNSSKISNNKETLDTNKIIPLKSSSPSDKEIQSLIESWLKGKANILSGLESKTLISVARPSLFNRVIDQRKKDSLLGQRQIIDARITSINIVQRADKRIAADVELNYQDKRISSSGEILSETVIPSLKVKYILGKNKNIWQVVDYISSN
ncbi:IMS domain-containing protein [Prochlorococcus marinus]|uniref:Cell division protein n=1 Tax=Prochlorococcus marinus XMU1408 TaxID=2213228 RepID=A0A318R122_PROMR|nr:IMS domain-containing protein [Prochlorococcus marinus]MBW3042468.1 cell division protein [Prochlorococcus marinus str. XMU1408]PYE01203.1 cell division protein [Prochlorococcus marinus XMU1408]